MIPSFPPVRTENPRSANEKCLGTRLTDWFLWVEVNRSDRALMTGQLESGREPLYEREGVGPYLVYNL